MMVTTTVEDLLKIDARTGLYTTTKMLTREKVNELSSKGLKILDSEESDKYPRTHQVIWRDAIVKTEDIESDNLNLAQHLWLLATEARRGNTTQEIL